MNTLSRRHRWRRNSPAFLLTLLLSACAPPAGRSLWHGAAPPPHHDTPSLDVAPDGTIIAGHKKTGKPGSST
ncbi:hypothetical protein GOB93_14935 [Acetobacter musti]|uniref:Uncharacterized protein n=1 Tax=Acetobacter musti TaxID=864732 RepID=A0ABX0JVN6_9PROT|nr:hypothetical protein [Acetobacter musti]NHN85927.1 hypothetical protein [Acetobacter musti]